MRTRHSKRALGMAVSVVLATAGMSAADTITKADNSDALNLDSSWGTGKAPTSNDIASFDSTYLQTANLSLGANLNWGGLSIVGAPNNITFNSGFTLTLGAGGVLSSTNKTFTFNNNFALAADQSWTVTSGTFIPVGTTNTQGHTLTLVGSSTLQFKGDITGGGDIVVDHSNVKWTGGTKATASNLIIDAGGALTFDNTSVVAARAASLTLNGIGGVAKLSVTQTSTAANTVDTIGGAMTVNGQGQILVSPRSTLSSELVASSLVLNQGATLLVTGTNLGTAAIGTGSNTTNVVFTTAPTLVGSGSAGTTTVGVLPFAFGDTTSGGTGFGATAGLVTYDSTYGVRLLAANEYINSITDGQGTADNARLANSSGTGPVTTSLALSTTVNSLSLVVSGANTASGSGITVDGAGKLVIKSGVIYASQQVTGQATGGNANNAMVLNIAKIDLGGRAGSILVASNGNNNGNTAAPLQLNSEITNDGGNGVVFGGTGETILGGGVTNTYTGPTILTSGILRLAKTVSNIGLTTDLIMNGGTLLKNSNAIADTASLTLNAGTFWFDTTTSSGNNNATETLNNFTMNGGSIGNHGTNASFIINGNAVLNSGTLVMNQAGDVTVGGATTLSGGQLVARESSSTTAFNALTSLNTVTINNLASGAYTPISVKSDATNKGAQLTLNGDLTFNGNATNANTVLIDTSDGSLANQGVIQLNGARTFNIGNGAAAVDLAVVPSLVNGASNGSLIKTGAGTLAINGIGTYTGGTTVSAGTLRVGGSLGTGIVTVGDNAILQLDAATAIGDSAALTLGNGSTVNLNFSSGLSETVGALRFGGTTYLSGTFNATTNPTFFSGTGNLVATPEPSTLGLLAAGALGLLSRRRRRA